MPHVDLMTASQLSQHRARLTRWLCLLVVLYIAFNTAHIVVPNEIALDAGQYAVLHGLLALIVGRTSAAIGNRPAVTAAYVFVTLGPPFCMCAAAVVLYMQLRHYEEQLAGKPGHIQLWNDIALLWSSLREEMRATRQESRLASTPVVEPERTSSSTSEPSQTPEPDSRTAAEGQLNAAKIDWPSAPDWNQQTS